MYHLSQCLISIRSDSTFLKYVFVLFFVFCSVHIHLSLPNRFDIPLLSTVPHADSYHKHQTFLKSSISFVYHNALEILKARIPPYSCFTSRSTYQLQGILKVLKVLLKVQYYIRSSFLSSSKH